MTIKGVWKELFLRSLFPSLTLCKVKMGPREGFHLKNESIRFEIWELGFSYLGLIYTVS